MILVFYIIKMLLWKVDLRKKALKIIKERNNIDKSSKKHMNEYKLIIYINNIILKIICGFVLNIFYTITINKFILQGFNKYNIYCFVKKSWTVEINYITSNYITCIAFQPIQNTYKKKMCIPLDLIFFFKFCVKKKHFVQNRYYIHLTFTNAKKMSYFSTFSMLFFYWIYFITCLYKSTNNTI